MPQELLSEAAEYLETWAEEDERARELELRLRLVAGGIKENWPTSVISKTVEWTDPATGTAVVAHHRAGVWEVSRFPPNAREPESGITAHSLTEAADYANQWLG